MLLQASQAMSCEFMTFMSVRRSNGSFIESSLGQTAALLYRLIAWFAINKVANERIVVISDSWYQE
jgi:hypothetical protein